MAKTMNELILRQKKCPYLTLRVSLRHRHKSMTSLDPDPFHPSQIQNGGQFKRQLVRWSFGPCRRLSQLQTSKNQRNYSMFTSSLPISPIARDTGSNSYSNWPSSFEVYKEQRFGAHSPRKSCKFLYVSLQRSCPNVWFLLFRY